MYNFRLPSWDVLTSTGETKYDGVFAYAYAKRGQVLLAERWVKEYPTVKIATAHPGWSDTPGLDDAFGTNTGFLRP